MIARGCSRWPIPGGACRAEGLARRARLRARLAKPGARVHTSLVLLGGDPLGDPLLMALWSRARANSYTVLNSAVEEACRK